MKVYSKLFLLKGRDEMPANEKGEATVNALERIPLSIAYPSAIRPPTMASPQPGTLYKLNVMKIRATKKYNKNAKNSDKKNRGTGLPTSKTSIGKLNERDIPKVSEDKFLRAALCITVLH